MAKINTSIDLNSITLKELDFLSTAVGSLNSELLTPDEQRLKQNFLDMFSPFSSVATIYLKKNEIRKNADAIFEDA